MEFKGTVITDKYVIFKDDVFSNVYPCKIVYNNIEFGSVDHLFMYFKAVHFNDTEAIESIINISDPRLSKRIGRKIKNFDESIWENVRENYLYEAVYLKFSQNEDLKSLLLEYGKDHKFVQGSRCDYIYGIGIRFKDEEAKDETNWKGLNIAGKVLDKVYEELSK
jgi:ribA/ribD-fused uncharacterized protein